MASSAPLIVALFAGIEAYQKKVKAQKENSQEMQLIENLKKLENIVKPSRSEQRRRIATTRMLSDTQRRKLKRQALDASLNYHLLGENGTKYYLRSKVRKRNAAFGNLKTPQEM